MQLYGGSRQDEVINEMIKMNTGQPQGLAAYGKEPLNHQSSERRAKLALIQAQDYQDKILTRVQYLQNEERKLSLKIN